jgi:DNA-directed DNA polymerase III PolC
LKIPFVNLHSHTNASLFDGLSPAPVHMDAVFASGMDAMAITDHGNCNAFPYQLFHQEEMAKRGEKFKNIYGCEAYLISSIDAWREEYNKRNSAGENLKEFEKDPFYKRNHFLLLAQNQKGLNNLFSLISESNTDRYYYKYPRIDLELLRKYSEGLIGSSACLGGYLATSHHLYSHLSETDVLEDMRRRVQILMDIFGGRFFGEIQWNAIPAQHEINRMILRLGQEMGFKTISTNDSHYPTRELWQERELYKRLGWRTSDKGVAKEDRPASWMSENLPDSVDKIGYELYPKTGEETFAAFRKYTKQLQTESLFEEEEVLGTLSNTLEVSDMIEEFSPERKVRLPSFVAPEGEEDVALAKECIAGLKRLGLDKKKKYVERLKEEIFVIQNRGFSRYFLTMKAVVDKAKQTQLIGCSRGSASGALSAYCLGITQMDPIRFNLQFERFLLRDAIGMPDIDLDFQSPMELKERLIQDWGKDSVVPISNWNTLQLRSLIKDISKFYDIPYQEVNEVTGKMLFEATPAAKKEHDITSGVYTPTYEEAKKYSRTFSDFLEAYPQIDQHVKHLFGQLRSCSRHAGGVIISDNINQHIPLIRSGGVIQSPWCEGQNVRHLEPLGFIKFDILGLATLRMMHDAIGHILRRSGKVSSFENISNWYNENLHPDRINFEDKKVYEHVFHEGNFVGTFQFTEKGIQNFATKVKPNNLEEISAISAIYRPGPLGIGADKLYVEAREKPEKVVYKHKLIKKVLGDTFGIIAYQEQIASLAHELGKDISLNEGNVLRKLLVKKGTGKHEKELEAIKEKLIAGCIEKGIAEKDALELYKSIEFFGKYGFNKCLSKNTKVQTRSGYVTIDDIKSGEYINSKNGFVKVVNKLERGIRKVVEITTFSGKKLTCTLEHKLETLEGMKTIKEILNRNLSIITKAMLDKIVLVRYLEPEKTFDLEVDHPSHTFYANDISVSNSHSTAYSTISYQCAYLWTHYPSEWAVAYLEKEEDKHKERAISLIKNQGFEVEPLDVNKSGPSWSIGTSGLVAPLSSILGLGEKAIEQVVACRPFYTIEDFLFNENINYSKMNRKAIQALLFGGALSELCDSRFANMKHFALAALGCDTKERPKTRKKFEELVEKYKGVPDFTKEERIDFTTEITGVYPIDEVLTKEALMMIRLGGAVPISEFSSEQIPVWFISRKSVNKKTNKGKDYIILEVTDSNHVTLQIKVWGIFPGDRIMMNTIYSARLTYQEQWGFSVRSARALKQVAG